MNKVVVVIVGAIVVLVAAIAAGVLLTNHQNNNYAPTTTTTNNGTNVIPNTSTTTSSIPIKSTTTSSTPTNTTNNTITNIHNNTFYFLNQTGQHYYYVFVFSYNEYETMLNTSSVHMILQLFVIPQGGIAITKNIVVGNYVFLIGYTYQPQPLNVTIGHQYLIGIDTNTGYIYQFTYEGNWVGPLP